MPENRKRGRPSKQPPPVDPSAVEEVKRMAKGYADAKLRARYFENKRRSLIRRANVDILQSEEQGTVVYDKDEVSRWPGKDKAAMEQYITDKQTVLCIEKGIESIADTRTRQVAGETILNGKSCDALVDTMEMERRMLFYRKKEALMLIADYVRSVRSVRRQQV